MIFRKDVQDVQRKVTNEKEVEEKAFEELMQSNNGVDFHNEVEQLKTDEIVGLPFYIEETTEFNTSFGEMVKMYVRMVEKSDKGNDIYAVVRTTSTPIVAKIKEIAEKGYIPTPAPVIIYKKKSQQSGNRYYSIEIYKK